MFSSEVKTHAQEINPQRPRRRQAVKPGYIRTNPTEACTLPRIEKTEMQPLDVPDIKAFLDVLDNSEYSALLNLIKKHSKHTKKPEILRFRASLIGAVDGT